MRKNVFGILQWLARKARGLLGAASDEDVSQALASHLVSVEKRMLQRKRELEAMEQKLVHQEQVANKLLAEAERVASQTTLAASDVLTALQLFNQGFDPGLARGEEEREEGDGQP